MQRDAGQDDGGEGDQGLHALQARGLRAPAQEFAAVAWETLSRLQQSMTAKRSQLGGVDLEGGVCLGGGRVGRGSGRLGDLCCGAAMSGESRLDVRIWPDSHVWQGGFVEIIELSPGTRCPAMSGYGRILRPIGSRGAAKSKRDSGSC